MPEEGVARKQSPDAGTLASSDCCQDTHAFAQASRKLSSGGRVFEDQATTECLLS